MKKFILLLMLVFSITLFAKDYKFVAIGGVLEMQVGTEVVKEVYSELGESIVVDAYPASRAAKLASTGDYDGEVMRAFLYGNLFPALIRVPTSYYSLKITTYTKKGSNIVINSVEDLSKYKVAVVRGIKMQAEMAKNAKSVNEVATSDQLFKMVSSGRVDVIISNTLSAKKVMKDANITNVVATEKPLREVKFFHYLHSRNSADVEKVNEKIIEMKENGKMDMLIKAIEDKLLK